ncbi:MAG: IS110 family transposase [Boseongicola sp.]|nr:IS110 family transposase [Boseongicola sp.]
MSKSLNDVAPSMGEVSTLYVAVEVSGKSWVIGIGDLVEPGKVGMHTLPPADVEGLVEKIGKVRARADGPSRVLLTYEAGYEGFWLARWLGEHAPEIEVVICDPASLEVVRKKRKAKTDRIDARRMVRALRAWDGGEAEALSVVRIPTVEEEDAKRLLRHRERLVKERTSLGNTIKALLKLHGIRDLDPRSPTFAAGLAEARTVYGMPLPPGLRNEIEATHERLGKVMEQLADVERKKVSLIAEAASLAKDGAEAGTGDAHAGSKTASRPAVPGAAALLVQLTGIGANDALLLQNEVFYRDFRNRRELGGWAGLAPVPWASGGVENDQGISKAGRPAVRKHLVQMAWRWLRWQPDSEIAKWFDRYCARRRDKVMRKRAIVAVARKLLVALWRYVRDGLVPTGAVLAKTTTS